MRCIFILFVLFDDLPQYLVGFWAHILNCKRNQLLPFNLSVLSLKRLQTIPMLGDRLSRFWINFDQTQIFCFNAHLLLNYYQVQKSIWFLYRFLNSTIVSEPLFMNSAELLHFVFRQAARCKCQKEDHVLDEIVLSFYACKWALEYILPSEFLCLLILFFIFYDLFEIVCRLYSWCHFFYMVKVNPIKSCKFFLD